jgi:hypothetical protein
MLGARICLLMALLAGATSIATAEDYVLPTEVTVLTEEQILNQIIGNTLENGNGRWVEYFEPPTGDQKKGRFKGKAGIAGRYSGSWEVKEDLMCWQHDKRVGHDQCVTTVLDGDIVTWYQTNGFPKYNGHPPIKLISGNPNNF